MAQKGFKRKLSAILSTDVEGYSCLMDDEEATVRTITSYRTAIADLVQSFRGLKMGMIRTLSFEQEKELRNAIKDKCPDQLKLRFTLWTRWAVQQLISQPLEFYTPEVFAKSIRTKSKGCQDELKSALNIQKSLMQHD